MKVVEASWFAGVKREMWNVEPMREPETDADSEQVRGMLKQPRLEVDRFATALRKGWLQLHPGGGAPSC